MKPKPLDFERPIIDLEKQLEALVKQSEKAEVDLSEEIAEMRTRLEETGRSIYSALHAGLRGNLL